MESWPGSSFSAQFLLRESGTEEELSVLLLQLRGRSTPALVSTLFNMSSPMLGRGPSSSLAPDLWERE